jgi:hypothetical protein
MCVGRKQFCVGQKQFCVGQQQFCVGRQQFCAKFLFRVNTPLRQSRGSKWNVFEQKATAVAATVFWQQFFSSPRLVHLFNNAHKQCTFI